MTSQEFEDRFARGEFFDEFYLFIKNKFTGKTPKEIFDDIKNDIDLKISFKEEKVTVRISNEMREILLNALAQAWLEKKIETVDEYMDAVRQVKEMK